MNLPSNDDENLWVSWDEYHRLIARLSLTVHESGWKFDKILCLARGGLRVGDQMSRIFDVPLAILATSSYREAAGTQQGELDIAQYITMTRGELTGKILLVDDPFDSGVTLERVGRHLKALSRRDRSAVGGAVVQGLLQGGARTTTSPTWRPIPGSTNPSKNTTRYVRTTCPAWLKRGRHGGDATQG